MKKSKIIIGLLIGTILTITTTVVAATAFSAKDVTYDNESSKLTSTNVQNAIDELNDKAKYYCPEGKVCTKIWNFDYTGGEQVFEVPTTGTYILETWGAQGGSYNDTYYGGYGAYSIGNINLNSSDILFINVGGSTTNTSGGYNGGGNGIYGAQKGNGGGGSTHISFKSGLLSTLESSKDKILIIAGGGGGAGDAISGGNAGGIIGNVGPSIDNLDQPYLHFRGTEGTQISAGYATTGFSGGTPAIVGGAGGFGYGGTCPNVYECGTSWDAIEGCGGPGGGSGLYGGGGSSRGHGGGGGGSGYIGNSNLTNKAMYCHNCATSNETSTKTISTTNVSSTPISKYAKIGNGYARITHIIE